MKITPLSFQPVVKHGRQSPNEPRVYIRLTDNHISLSSALAFFMQLEAGDHIQLAFDDDGSRTPKLYVAKMPAAESGHTLTVRKQSKTYALYAQHPGAVTSILQLHGIARTQYHAIKWEVADKPKHHTDGDITWYEMGKAEYVSRTKKGGKVS